MNALLDNQHILIIGGTSGIGLSTARLACEQGAEVTVTGRSQERIEAAKKEVPNLRAIQLDATDQQGTIDLIASHQHVDHLFLTVGQLAIDDGLKTEIDDFYPAMETRFMAAVNAIKSVTPKIRRTGSITLMSGTAGLRPLPGASVASASCGAIDALARGLAVDLAPIRVNSIQPGYVDTPLLDSLLGEQKEAILQEATKGIPVGRIGKPEEIAHAVLFLMTNEYVSGINLVVDGGALVK